MIEDATAQRLFDGLPHELVEASLRSLAETTMDLTIVNPAMADVYREAGFGIFWSGVTKKK